MLIVSIGSIWIATARAMPTSRFRFRLVYPARPARGASIQLRAQLLQYRRGLVPRHPLRATQDELFERCSRRAQIAEPSMQRPRLAPQFGDVGGQHQHRLDYRHRPLVALRLNEARLEVVLQAQQDVAVRDRRVVFGQQLAFLTGSRLQQLAQLGGAADLAAMERIEDQPFASIGEPDQKMAGEGEADRVPTLGAAGMHVEDSEGYRQALPAVHDTHQIGVLQIVIGQLVAGIAVLQKDDLVERAGARGEIARDTGVTGDILDEQVQMLAIACGPDPRTLERGESQCRLGDRQDRLARGAEIAQKARADFWIVSFRGLAHPPSIPESELLYLDRSRRRGDRRVRNLRAGGWGWSLRLGGDRGPGADLDIGDDPLHVWNVPRRIGDAVEFSLRTGRPDQVDRFVDGFDRIIDRADLAGEDEIRTQLRADPSVSDALPCALARRHLDLVINHANPRDPACDLLGLSLQFRIRGHAGQQRATLVDGDGEIALHQRVHLQPSVLDVRLDREIVNSSGNATFLIGSIARAPSSS